MHFAFLTVLLTVIPVAHVGGEIAAPEPATLFAPGHFHAVVRVPQSNDRLFIIGRWSMRALRVTIERPGGNTVLHGGDLPGARFGVELPADAWQAREVIVDGTSVNAAGGPRLVAGTTLYARATESWPAIALFGMFAGLAAVAALIALAMRSPVTAWFAALFATDALGELPILGAIRPPAIVNQPLHAFVVLLAIVASIGFARAYLGRTILPRSGLIAAIGVGLLQVLYIVGSDVWQDRFLSVAQPYEILVLVSLSVVFVGYGIRAIRAGRRDAGWYVASEVASIVGFFIEEFNNPLTGDIIANALSAVALTCGLAFALRRRENERARLERAVRIDALTGLVNRGTFDTTLALEWSRSTRSGGTLAAIMIDVDHFKRYNDVFGHLKGDAALRTIATALAIIVQRREDCIARYGGEEFIALLPGTDREAARVVADRIRREIELLALPNADGTGSVTVSVGVAVMEPTPEVEPSTLVAHADDALYDAKRAGRNRVVAYDGDRSAEATSPLVR